MYLNTVVFVMMKILNNLSVQHQETILRNYGTHYTATKFFVYKDYLT